MIWSKVLEAMKAVAKKFGVVVSTTLFLRKFTAKHYFEKNKVIIFRHN